MFLIRSMMAFGFAIPLLTEICIWLDSAIFGLASSLIGAFFKLVSISSEIYSENDILKSIIGRITILAGVYALFRLGIMFINYLMDPSKLSESGKKGSDIIKRVIIAAALLISSAFIFKYLNDFQKIILLGDKDVKLKPLIPTLIYGENGEEFQNKTIEQSDQLVNNMWILFFNKKNNASTDSATACDLTYRQVKNGSKSIMDLTGCQYEYNYTPILPLILGIALCYFFIIYTIELAKRIFKLIVLQIVSPIPIIMSIDPSQKNKLSNFFKTYLGIYLQVFFRVLSFYLAFVVIDLLTNFDPKTGGLGIYLYLLLVLGVFAAAKEIPKLIEDALGLKLGLDSGGKGFGKVLAGIIGGGVGLAGGAIAGGITGGAGGALAGATSGLFGGITSGAGAKNVGAGISAAIKNIGKSGTLGAQVYDSGGLGKFMYGKARNFTGAQRRDAADLKDFDKKIKTTQGSIDNINQANSLREKLQAKLEESFVKEHGSKQDFYDQDETLQKLIYTQQRNIQTGFYSDDNQEYIEIDQQRIRDRKAELDQMYKQNQDSYFNTQIREASSESGTSDSAIRDALEDYNSFVHSKGMSDRSIQSFDDMSKAKTDLEKDIRDKTQELEKHKKQKSDYENDWKRKASSSVTNDNPVGKPRGKNNNSQ